MKTFAEIQKRALDIKKAYAQKNVKQWTAAEYFRGLIKDIGDLSKILMVQDGYRDDVKQDSKKALAHELSDVLWSVFVLANELGVDLEKEFEKTMDELEKKINI